MITKTLIELLLLNMNIHIYIPLAQLRSNAQKLLSSKCLSCLVLPCTQFLAHLIKIIFVINKFKIVVAEMNCLLLHDMKCVITLKYYSHFVCARLMCAQTDFMNFPHIHFIVESFEGTNCAAYK